MKTKGTLMQRNGFNTYYKCPKLVIFDELRLDHQCKTSKQGPL